MSVSYGSRPAVADQNGGRGQQSFVPVVAFKDILLKNALSNVVNRGTALFGDALDGRLEIGVIFA